MASDSAQPVTQLLTAIRDGDDTARRRLWDIVYEKLHTIAQAQLATEAPGQTLQPTALVNEAYLRLCGSDQVDWANRRHFFAVAAKIMRHIRVDDARRRNRNKRGGDSRPLSIDATDDHDCALAAILAGSDSDPAETLALDEALSRLEQIDPLKVEVVMLRFHAGLTREQIGELLGMSPRTVDNEWYFARSWLRRVLSGQ